MKYPMKSQKSSHINGYIPTAANGSHQSSPRVNTHETIVAERFVPLLSLLEILGAQAQR